MVNVPITPHKTRRDSSKHSLTPESKLAAESRPKRLAQQPSKFLHLIFLSKCLFVHFTLYILSVVHSMII